MQETYYAATKESEKLVPLEEKSRISRQVELRKVWCCLPILHTAAICQIDGWMDRLMGWWWIQNALDTE